MLKDNSQERIDLCDEQGRPTGETRSRAEVHAEGLWHRTVHIWVLDRGGRALLQQRSHLKENHPGLWDISSAGHMDAGEGSVQAAVRELKEELGLTVLPSQLRLLGETVDFQELPGGYLDREYHDVYVAHLTPAQLGGLRFEDGEVEAVRFVTGPELERELRRHPELFAPHPKEYPLVLRLLGAALS